MPLAVVLILLVVGSLVFHFLSPWTFTPIASNWSTIDDTVGITLWVTGFVFVAVNLFMAYAIIRYRHRKDRRAAYDPENKKLEWALTIFTAIGVAAMLAPGLFVWAKFVDVPENALEVEAVGQQWHWSYRLPGEDGEFGNADTRLVSSDNPFGLDPDDPLGQDDVLVSGAEVHLPLDRPVRFWLRSKDVLHNFTVAQFRVKMDLVPGMVTHMWLTPTRTGRFEVLCEELCGIAHHTMRGAVIVEEPEAFQAWAASFPTFSERQAAAEGNAAAGAAQYAVCAACHGPQGQGLQAMNAPNLTGLGGWYIEHQLENFKAGIRGAHEKDTYGRQMAPMARTLATPQAVDNVIAHIATLPGAPAQATVEGNAAAGAEYFTVCAYCHGAQGQGRQAMNAPQLAGQDDWYLVRQLENFRAGIRGGHPQDYYGKQMSFMADILQKDDHAISDVVAYINTLPVDSETDDGAVPARARPGTADTLHGNAAGVH
ncbi:MAG TPA: c-type cytochrome [Woeseiaceae bacterium]|nr:c-type cytochrome [Woeseiaceae bacterium]